VGRSATVNGGVISKGRFLTLFCRSRPAASSSVGLAAIQLANWAGALPIALTRHSAKAAPLRVQGAQHVIATAESDVVAEVMRISGGRIEWPADALPALARGIEGARGGASEAGDFQDVPPQPDCRSAPLPRVQPASRKDHRDGVNTSVCFAESTSIRGVTAADRG
jgi:hypothetical protein